MPASIQRTLDSFLAQGAAGSAVIATGNDCKTIAYASPAAQALFGYGAEIVGMGAKDLYGVKHERDRLLEHLAIEGETDAHVFLRKKDGTPFYAHVALYLLDERGKLDGTGAIEGTAGITTEYTSIDDERKRAFARVFRLSQLEAAMDAKQHYLAGHAERVGELCRDIANMLPCTVLQGMDAKEFRMSLYFGGKLHDLGKLLVDSAVLNNGTRILRPGEGIRKHPELGLQLLQGIDEYKENQLIRDSILYHHEKWDGTGYPSGKAEYEIPLAARIVSVADAFDAICSTRGYNRPKSPLEALATVKADAGTHFCPDIVAAFEASLQQSNALKYYERLLRMHEKS
ncbi:HD domain-containing protein [Candidatus Woesearchaeota archaeon]|nr:HD domain-containing protein [Candidatus Woesearchaeota archaeon]